jgi:hypothetical protein
MIIAETPALSGAHAAHPDARQIMSGSTLRAGRTDDYRRTSAASVTTIWSATADWGWAVKRVTVPAASAKTIRFPTAFGDCSLPHR